MGSPSRKKAQRALGLQRQRELSGFSRLWASTVRMNSFPVPDAQAAAGQSLDT